MIVLEQHNQKQNKKILVFLTILVFLFLSCMLALVYTILVILPLKQDKIYLLHTKPKSEQIYTLTAMDEDITAVKLMTEKLLVQYVHLRETIEKISYEKRMDKLKLYNHTSLHNQFIALCEQKNSPLHIFYTNNITRSIEVISCIQIAKDQWHIEWQNQDYNHNTNEELQQKHYVSIIKMDLANVSDTKDKILENPIGLKVVDYQVVQKNI